MGFAVARSSGTSKFSWYCATSSSEGRSVSLLVSLADVGCYLGYTHHFGAKIGVFR